MIGIDSMRNKKKELEFNPNPPLTLCSKKFMVLYYKENGNVIWTSGGELFLLMEKEIFMSQKIAKGML